MDLSILLRGSIESGQSCTGKFSFLSSFFVYIWKEKKTNRHMLGLALTASARALFIFVYLENCSCSPLSFSFFFLKKKRLFDGFRQEVNKSPRYTHAAVAAR